MQNLLVLRFGNGIFEPLWNRNYVDHVQITAAETLGVEQRAAFYETAGATRDMIQSQCLQLTSLVAMEPPAAFDATAVRNEKIKVLQSIRPFTEETYRDRRRARAIRSRERPGRFHAAGRLSAGARREAGLDDGNLRRRETADRQLALGGRSVLPAHGQTPAEPRDRNRHPISAERRTWCFAGRTCPPIRWC